MNNKTTYMNEVLLQYALTSDNPKSKILRDYLVKNITKINDDDFTVMSEPVTKDDIMSDDTIIETLMESSDNFVGICIQPYHALDQYLWETYYAYLATSCCRWTNDNTKDSTLIVFNIGHYFQPENLIVGQIVINENTYRLFGVTNNGKNMIYLVNLKVLEDIFRDYDKHSEIPELLAVLHYIYYGHVDGICYEDKEHIVDILKELKEEFIEKYPDLYELSLQRKYIKLDLKGVMSRSTKQAQLELSKRVS